MSAESAAAQSTAATTDLRLVRTVRYAAGTTLAVALAMGIDWQLAYLTPVLALMFLAPPAQRPNPNKLVGFIGIVAVASMAGVAMSGTILMYPVAFLLLEGLILFLLFYRHARGAPPMLTMWLMIAVTVIPVVALQSMDLTLAVAQGLVVGAAVAVAVVWIAYALIPDPADAEPGASAATGAKDVFPVVALFLYLGLTSVLILVFVALLSMQPDLATGKKAGKALIVGNLIGGVAAIIVFELLVMVPELYFLLLLTLIVGLSFGGRLFSGSPTGPLFGQAYSTMLLVVLSATSAFGEADAKAWTRVLQIITAVVYLVAAHAAVRSLVGKSETDHATT
jgi:uncharacterized membrane protein YccC